MASRTVFVRMVSNKANANFEVLEGGDLALTTDDLGNVLSIKKKFGYSQTYRKKSDGQIRGVSGIKNISVEYQGGYKGIRQGIVTWTANSLDDLTKISDNFKSESKLPILIFPKSGILVPRNISIEAEELILALYLIISKIPSARLGAPEDVANAVIFLASPQSDYINGETLHVNGGMYMA